jgi:uncharacterized alpha-E superfamily protein
MLGRTAANLFWLSRYVERAENMTRLLEVGYRMSLTATREDSRSEHLVSMMRAAEVDEGFWKKYEEADVASVANYMLFDPSNPSSVYSCLKSARTNARAVRTAITTDMWGSLNSTWLAFSQLRPSQVTGNKLPELLLWIRHSGNEFRGALLGTILRDDGFAFSQAGNFIERADNTARILDMKYYVLLPRANFVGGDVDIQQWSLILRAASAHRSYRHFYRDRFKAWNIADFLILRPEMPRSLLFSALYIRDTLKVLADFYGERVACHDQSDKLLAMLENNNMDRIFQRGLHEFLTDFQECNDQVSDAISDCYNFY